MVRSLFPDLRPIVGMIHLPPLPGAPNYGGRPVAAIAEAATIDATRLEAGGIDAVLMQNSNDHPPRQHVPKATVAAYAAIAERVRAALTIPLGINVLKSDVEATLGVAVAVDAAFVRLKSYIGSEIGAEGVTQGVAAAAIALRRELGYADRLEIWADAIQPTSVPLGAVTPELLVRWCVEFGEADRVVVTGRSLDESAAIIAASRDGVPVPLILGGGVAPSTARRSLEAADGVIIGRYLRGDSLTDPIDEDRVRHFVAAARGD